MSAAPPAQGLAAEQRRMMLALAAASDDALARVVAVFDRMADRREADALLDAARPRLRRLRPPRPVALPRLLFLPLDGAIVEPRGWRRQDGTLPRSALRPLAEAVREAIGLAAATIEEAIAGTTFADIAVIAVAGQRLWQAATAVAGGLGTPARWAETGLGAAEFDHCRRLAAGVWRQAGPLWAALAAATEGPPELLVEAAIAAAKGEDPIVLDAMLATILLKAARPGSVAAAAARAGQQGLAERALDRWIEDCAPEILPDDPQSAARLAEAFAEAIEDVDASPLARRADRRQRIAALRRQVDETCRGVLAEAAARTLMDPVSRAAGRIDDAAMSGMEQAARTLRRLEQAGRSLGGGTAYDAMLRRMTETLAGLRSSRGADAVDLARLTEILAGPEAALRLLED